MGRFLPLVHSSNIENIAIMKISWIFRGTLVFLIYSFYEEITPQEWNMIEKEASKVKGELNGSFD